MPSRLSHARVCIGFLVFTTVLGYLTLTRWPRGLEALVRSAQLSNAPASPPSWFLGIFVGPGSISRRQIIRSTWASRYTHPSYEYRFMIGDYSKTPWAPIIDAENATYGDIWVMEDYKNENYETANKVKNMEFFSHMAKQQRLGQIRRYDFVSKVDDDNWVNLPIYWENFMASRLPGGEKYRPDAMTMIARPFAWGMSYVCPAGRMYTISWPLVEYYAKKYSDHSERKHNERITEDQLMGWYLEQDKFDDLEFVVMEYEQAYDVGVEFVITNSTSDTMMAHSIKSDQQMLEIGGLFDDNGKWNGKKLEGVTNFNRTTPEMLRRFGPPTDEELKQLKLEWAKGPPPENPLDSLDWKMIHDIITIEDRQRLGNLYPLNLGNNNASTGCAAPMYFNPTRKYN